MTTRLTKSWVLLLLTGVAWSAVGQTDETTAAVDLATDLRTVIVLAGFPCGRVQSIARPDPSDYDVWCDVDRRYRVWISEEKNLVVENRASPARHAPAGVSEHGIFMNRQLSAIVNLAGHDCAGVVSFERVGPRDNIVTCMDQSKFRIHVTREGRISVDRHTLNK